MGALEMTEREAWLELAKMFASGEPTWRWGCWGGYVIGICQGFTVQLDDGRITSWQAEQMMSRLDEYFNPNGKDPTFDFFWPDNIRRTSRTLRATACCFLAAMAEEEER